MKKFLNKATKMWKFFRKPLVLFASFAILYSYAVYLFSYDRIAGDAASHLLLAVSPILKIGVPYKDVWEIKPPVWPLTLYFWSIIFGFKIVSIRILNLLVGVFVVLLAKVIYKKVFSSPVYEIYFAFTLVITFSPLLYSNMFLPTELLGLMFSIMALWSLIYFKKEFNKFYYSGLLFLAASQTKEPFTLAVFAVLPVLFDKYLKYGFAKMLLHALQFVLGMASGILILYIYLTSFGSLNAYMQVAQYKQKYFPLTYERLIQNFMPGFSAAERTFTEFSYGYLFMFILTIVIFLIGNKFNKIVMYNSKNERLESKHLSFLDKNSLHKYIILFYAIGSFMGFGLGGSFGQHYLIQIVFPFYALYGLFVSYIFKQVLLLKNKSKKYFITAVLIFIISLFITLPKRQYLKSYSFFKFSNIIL